MTEETQTKGERTRLQIEDSAVELFMENGYHATSMRQIAEHSGLALGGIYNHFKSKEEIFEAIVVDKHPYKKILPILSEVQGDTIEEFLNNAARIVITELTSQPYYVKLMLIEIVEFNGAHGAALLKEIVPKILPIFEKIVKNNSHALYKYIPAFLPSGRLKQIVAKTNLIAFLILTNLSNVGDILYCIVLCHSSK